MKRRLTSAGLTLAVTASMLALLAAPALADHPTDAFTTATPGEPVITSGGEGAEWELLDTFLTGNTHSDLDFFTQGGEFFVSVGTINVGPNAGGQTILQLTEEGEVSPSFVASHPSASCVSDPLAALGLQHDVEATPKGDTILNIENPFALRVDTQLLIDATDAPTRCHDGGETGLDALGLLGAPQGGLELLDVSDVTDPTEIGLTSHIGEAHTVNIDPKRPHIAYVVTSDSVGTSLSEESGDFERANESGGLSLDGFEVADMSSCMNVNDRAAFAADASVEEKRERCRPEVFRYQYPSAEIVLGHTNQGRIFGCHELEIYPNDQLTCGSGSAAILFDMAGAFDDNGTPDDFTDDSPRGTPLPCRVRPSTSGPAFTTGAMVTDCVVGEDADGEQIDLSVSGYDEPSLEGVEHVGSAHHMGRESLIGAAQPDYGAAEDVDFDHEAELTHSGNFMITTDERGGGVAPPGATCSPGIDNPTGNGGLHAYAVDRLDTERPVVLDAEGAYDPEASAEEAFDAYARTPEGDKAIFRVEEAIQRGPQASICTAHVFQQIPGQNRIFMGWYSQGTRVVDYTENPDGTFEFSSAGFFIPQNADEWVSHIFKMEENDDGTFTYFGVASDFNLTGGGRNAIDVYKVTLPAPPEPLITGPTPSDRPGDTPSEAPSGAPTGAPTPPPTTPPGGSQTEVDRLSGGSRVDTAVGVSQDAFADGADTVAIARADDYADALSGGPLAAQLEAPLLLTSTDELSAPTAAEIERLGASEAVILGGTDAISPAVERDLQEAGLEVRRVRGPNRFATSVAVMEELPDDDDRVFVAEGFDLDPARGFPDAVSAGPLAAAAADPILLAVTDSLPPETEQALDGIGEAVVMGGPDAISEEVEGDIAAVGASTRRLAGADRYETSRAAYEEAIGEGADPSLLFLATGTDFPDALAAGPAAAVTGGTLLLVDPNDLSSSPSTEQAIRERADQLTRIVLVGGDGAISEEVEADVRALLGSDGGQSDQQMASATQTQPSTDGLLLLGLAVLPVAGLVGRRRQRTRR